MISYSNQTVGSLENINSFQNNNSNLNNINYSAGTQYYALTEKLAWIKATNLNDSMNITTPKFLKDKYYKIMKVAS